MPTTPLAGQDPVPSITRLAARTLRRLRSPAHLLCGTLAAMCLSACGGDAPSAAPTPLGPARAMAAEAVREGLAGALLGTLDRHTEQRGVAGVRRLGQAGALQRDDWFALGSNGKAMTAVAAARMVARGELAWSSRIVEVLPELAADMHPAYRAVTLDDLLAHRGGVLAFTMATDFQRFSDTYTGPIPEGMHERRLAFARWLLAQPPEAGVVPGQTMVYSNAGYTLAALMLEARAGKDFEHIHARDVAQPLGLDLAWTRPDRIDPGQPAGHEGEHGAVAPAIPPSDDEQALIDVMAPSGGRAMQADAYARWLRLHLEALAGQDTPLPAAYVARLKAAREGDYVLGWMRVTVEGIPRLSHLGSEDGFTSLAMLDLSGERATYLLTNTAYYGAGEHWVSRMVQESVLALDAAARR